MNKAPVMFRVYRGRRGRRGRTGSMPKHEWSEDGLRVRFESQPGQWGDWSSPLAGITDQTRSTT